MNPPSTDRQKLDDNDLDAALSIFRSIPKTPGVNEPSGLGNPDGFSSYGRRTWDRRRSGRNRVRVPASD